MADNPITVPLPQDLPTNWTYGQTIGATGTDVGLTQQHGYNYLGQQVNAAQQAAEELGEAFSGLPSLGSDGKIPVSQLPDLDFLPLTGGTVTGPITLPGDPVQVLQAAPKQYVDTVGANAAALIRSYPIASGQTVTAGQVVDVSNPGQLGSYAEGSVVQLNENGTPVDFYIAKHNYEPGLNGNGRTLLVRKEVYANQPWNLSSINVYAGSTVDNWLNTTYKAMLDTDVQNAMQETSFFYTPGSNNMNLSTLSRAIFILSLTELGKSNSAANVEGITLPTYSALQKAYLNETPNNQWTRTPSTGSVMYAWILSSTADIINPSVANSNGVRPVFTLPSSFQITPSDTFVYTSGTPSQAIALQSGSAGDTIPVIFQGVAQLSGVTQGQQITSPGVNGFGAMDGWLSVAPYWRPKQVVFGSYVGTGASGESSPNSVVIPDGDPDLFVIYATFNADQKVGSMPAATVKGIADLKNIPDSFTAGCGVCSESLSYSFGKVSNGAYYWYNQYSNFQLNNLNVRYFYAFLYL